MLVCLWYGERNKTRRTQSKSKREKKIPQWPTLEHFIKWNLLANVRLNVFSHQIQPIATHLHIPKPSYRTQNVCLYYFVDFIYYVCSSSLYIHSRTFSTSNWIDGCMCTFCFSIYFAIYTKMKENLLYSISIGLNNNLLRQFSGHHFIPAVGVYCSSFNFRIFFN